MSEMLSTPKAAKMLGINPQTLIRWEASGKLLPDFVSPGGHRRYRKETIELLSKDLFRTAQAWASSPQGAIPISDHYCHNSGAFQVRIMRLESALKERAGADEAFSLLVAIAGEIGNNSFDHNLGNWPDVPGIFFAYDLNKREIILADRGQGILTTLRRIRPQLTDDVSALKTAFTEIVSGRAPEPRGNGLKFVASVVQQNPIQLIFQSGNAIASFSSEKGRGLQIERVEESIRGTLVHVTF